VIKSSILADNCKIGDDCQLNDAVLGDHVTINDRAKLKKGTRVMPGETVKE
jgi:NDP-sugar pyrophosphorylase family protein